jgi:hypothetical protein
VTPSTSPCAAPQPPASLRRDRVEIALLLEEDRALGPLLSSYERAEKLGVPRSSMLHWEKRHKLLQSESALADLVESPQGSMFVQRVVLAARLTFIIEQHQGERGERLFLQRAGLDPFVACGKGSVGEAIDDTIHAIVDFGERQETRVREAFAGREPGQERVQALIAPDELFRSGAILMAIEPGSGFWLIGQRAASCDAEQWATVVTHVRETLPVRFEGGVGDEGGGLKKALDVKLCIGHFSDLFHGQYGVTRGCSPAMGRQVRQAQASLDKAEAAEARAREAGKDADAEQAATTSEARTGLQQALERQERMRQAVRGLGEVLHPFDLETGAAKTGEQVEQQMVQHLDRARDVASEARLGDKAFLAITKTAALVSSMALQVTCWHADCAHWVGKLGVPQDVQTWVLTVLLPLLYLSAVARRASTKEKRGELRQRSEAWLATALTGCAAWRQLDRSVQVMLLLGLQRKVELFQRTSSATEGLNGQVSRHFLVAHRLSAVRLQALRVLHNYVVRRSDGTTAAERLFRLKPEDLFEYLLDHLPLPSRPSRPRPHSPPPNQLLLN